MRARLRVSVCRLVLPLAAGLAGCGGDDEQRRAEPPPPPGQTEREPGARPEATGRRLDRARGKPKVKTVATGLEAPWEIAFLPEGGALITERAGRVRLLDADLDLRERPVGEVPVSQIGEGGLLGAAVDPDFARNRLVYLYRTTDSGNVVTRYRLSRGRLREQATIVSGIAAAPIHDGGRIRFGPDDRLYIATGDAADESLPQRAGSLNGKLLRMEPRAYRGEGGRPEVFSLGHRNPQGFDWERGSGRLYASEHGPDGDDEVNLLGRGSNYGWPEVRGSAHGRFAAPLAVYEESIAPSGASFVKLPGSSWTGDFLIGALVGEQIRRLRFAGRRVTRDEALFEGEFGRVRTVVEGPDGALYALTSNRDGRGSPRDGDDRVLRIVPPAG